MSTPRKGSGEPTFTSLTERCLQEADDFLTVAQVMASCPELTRKRAFASLCHLKKFGAVDFMVDAGVTYWFASPGGDRRSFTYEERQREEPGHRKPRAHKTRKPFRDLPGFSKE